MATPIQQTPQNVPPPRPGAREELDTLLESLHRHGVLRTANDLVAENAPIAKVLVDGLNQRGAQNAMQNLAIVLMTLSRLEPAEFYQCANALRAALQALARHQGKKPDEHEAPGVTGALRLLHDEALWHAVTPLSAALKALAQALEEPLDKPISRFSGKKTVDSPV